MDVNSWLPCAEKPNKLVPAFLSDESWMEFLRTTADIERCLVENFTLSLNEVSSSAVYPDQGMRQHWSGGPVAGTLHAAGGGCTLSVGRKVKMEIPAKDFK